MQWIRTKRNGYRNLLNLDLPEYTKLCIDTLLDEIEFLEKSIRNVQVKSVSAI